MKFENIPVEKVTNSCFQQYDRGDGLDDSIQRNGLLNPIHVRTREDGFELLGGHRRLEAHRRLGRSDIGAIVHDDIDDTTAAVLYWSDNIEREDLEPYERAVAIRAILGWAKGDEPLVDVESFVKRSGLSAGTLKRLRRLSRLCPEIGALIDGKILTQKEGLLLSRLDVAQQRLVYDRYAHKTGIDQDEDATHDPSLLKKLIDDELGIADPPDEKTAETKKDTDAKPEPENGQEPEKPADHIEPEKQENGEGGGVVADKELADDLPDDDSEDDMPAKSKRGTVVVEYGECHDRIRLVSTRTEWLVTLKLEKASQESQPTQDMKHGFEGADGTNPYKLMLAYIDAAAKMAKAKE